jgi:hypothetical protein
MEKAIDIRGGSRKRLYDSYEAWLKAGKPDHFVFDSRTGRGHVKTAEERRLDELKAKRFDMRTRRSTFHRRRRLEKRRAELAAGK